MDTKINIKSLLAAAAGFLILLFFMYAYFFIYSKIKFLSTETGSATRSITVLNEKKKEFEFAKSNLESQDKNLKVLESAFFSEDSFVDLLDTFESVAKKTGVKLEAKGATLPGSGKVAQISFELSGDFNSIAKFLVLLDKIRYTGTINKFSLSNKGESSKTLLANIDYLIFNFK